MCVHHPLDIAGLIIIPCNFDNQGFSFLDWVLGKVSVHERFTDGRSSHASFHFSSIVIMTTRTWAVWNKNRFLTYALPIFYFVIWVGGFVVNAIFIQSLKCQHSFFFIFLVFLILLIFSRSQSSHPSYRMLRDTGRSHHIRLLDSPPLLRCRCDCDLSCNLVQFR